MAKRFTDSGKWRNPWFRGLPIKAKVVWIYLCDECDLSGIWKADFELASVQVGFKFDIDDINIWFGDKVCLFNVDNLLILQYFNFQYGSSKDSWMAKVRARQRLEALGFTVTDGTVTPPSSHSGGTRLSIGIVRGIVKGINTTGDLKNKKTTSKLNGFDEFYADYPKKVGKTRAAQIWEKELKAGTNPDDIKKALARFKNYHRSKETPFQYIPHASTFMHNWRDWESEDSGMDLSEKERIDRFLRESEGCQT